MYISGRMQSDTFNAQAVPATFDLECYRVVVVVPAYNEERFIGSVLLKMKQYPIDVIVVDDGSADGTAAIAEMAGVKVIRLPVNQGKGAALNEGFSAVRKMDPDAVVVIDGDGQHQPEDLSRLVWPILNGEADISVGSRYLAETSNTPVVRRLGHKVFNLLTSALSGVYVSDSQCGFRAFSRKAYQNIEFHSDGFSVESEMQFIIQKLGLKFKEVSVTIRYGEDKKRSALLQGIMVLTGILNLISWYRPLQFIGLPDLFRRGR